jgi:hypothetical protein
MLAANTYDRAYIDGCRARIDAQVSAYRAVAAVSGERGDTAAAKLGRAIDSFEPAFFNGLVLQLDYSFVHRTRALEGKDGNPLNEVRVVCASLLTNDGVMAADKTIKMDPETSVLGYEVGDAIAVGEADFERLSRAFFAELEEKYL